MTQFEQVKKLAESGMNYAGFIFYEKSPRYVVNKIPFNTLKNFDKIKKVGVFVNESTDKIFEIVKAYGLDIVQLHGDETPIFCKMIAAEMPVIKAFGVTGHEDLNELTKPYIHAVDYFLFDTKAKHYGGTGKKFDWNFLKRYRHTKPYFLSGGIAPGDENEILNFIKEENLGCLHALDVNSRFETEPGIKDIELLKKIINNLQTSF